MVAALTRQVPPRRPPLAVFAPARLRRPRSADAAFAPVVPVAGGDDRSRRRVGRRVAVARRARCVHEADRRGEQPLAVRVRRAPLVGARRRAGHRRRRRSRLRLLRPPFPARPYVLGELGAPEPAVQLVGVVPRRVALPEGVDRVDAPSGVRTGATDARLLRRFLRARRRRFDLLRRREHCGRCVRHRGRA